MILTVPDTMGLGIYATNAIGMAFEALILGFTIFKTIGLRKEAEALGIRTSLHGLLLRDGKRFMLTRAQSIDSPQGSVQFGCLPLSLSHVIQKSLNLGLVE